MFVRKAIEEDLDSLMTLFAFAKKIMHASGNVHQWNDAYPSPDIILRDIALGNCYVACDDVTGEIMATMALIPGPDPTYSKIYDGEWSDNGGYYVIHRIAARKSGGGIAVKLFDYAFSQYPAIRIDTHRDNCIMHHVLRKYGFSYCGVIHLANGDPRDAYCLRKQ